MKNLYKIRFLTLIVLILSTLTSKQAVAQNQWGHTKEWRIHSMGEYVLTAFSGELDERYRLFEEREDLILIGVTTSQPDRFPENTPLPNLTEFVVNNTQVNDPILIWSKKTKDFINVKSNWKWKPLLEPKFHKGKDGNTFFIFENNCRSDEPNFENYLFRVKISGDSIHYERITSFFKNKKDDVREICETEDKIVTIISRFAKTISGQDYYYYDSVYVYDPKTFELIKTVHPFGNYKNVDASPTTNLVYDGKYFFLNAHQLSTGQFGSFMLDLDVDTSCYIDELNYVFSETIFCNLDGNIYAWNSERGLNRWHNGQWNKVNLPYGFPEKDQFGKYIFLVDYKGPDKPNTWQYFNPDSCTLGTKFIKDWLLTGDAWSGYAQLNVDQQVEYYQKFGYTWQPVRIVSVGADTFMFGNNMVAKLVDRQNTSIDGVVTKTLLVYPNPTSNGFITVSTPEDVTFTVTDLTGKIVLAGITNQNVDVLTLNKGIYLVTVSGYTPTKLVIE